MSSSPSITVYGATSTTFITTTISATPSQESVTLLYPLDPSPTTLYTALPTPSDPASRYFPSSLPILVLTDVIGYVVSTNGATIAIKTLIQPLPSGQATGSSTSTPTRGTNSTAIKACGDGWSCLSNAKQAGIIIGAVLGVLFILVLLCWGCCKRRRSRTSRDVEIAHLPRRSRSVKTVRGVGSVNGDTVQQTRSVAGSKKSAAESKNSSFSPTPSRPYRGVAARDFAVLRGDEKLKGTGGVPDRRHSAGEKLKSSGSDTDRRQSAGECVFGGVVKPRDTRWENFYSLPNKAPMNGQQRRFSEGGPGSGNATRLRGGRGGNLSMSRPKSMGTDERYRAKEREPQVMTRDDWHGSPKLGRSERERGSYTREYEGRREAIPAKSGIERGQDYGRAREYIPVKHSIESGQNYSRGRESIPQRNGTERVRVIRKTQSLSPPRHRSTPPKPRRRNSEHDHSKWLALLPLALQALHVLAEPKGGWGKYLPKEGKHGSPLEKLADEFRDAYKPEQDDTPPPVPPRNPARLARRQPLRRYPSRTRSRSVDQAYASTQPPRSRPSAEFARSYPPSAKMVPEVTGHRESRFREGFDRELSDSSMVPQAGSDIGGMPRRRVSRREAKRSWEARPGAGLSRSA